MHCRAFRLAPAAIALAGFIGVASVVVVGYVAGRAATYRLAKTGASINGSPASNYAWLAGLIRPEAVST